MTKRNAMVFAALTGAAVLAFTMCGDHGHAQVEACWPEMKRVHDSMEDLQRVRVELEDQTKILREIRDALRKKK